MALATSAAVANASPAVSALTTPPAPVVSVDLFTLNVTVPPLFSAVVPVPLTKFSVESSLVKVLASVPLTCTPMFCNALSAFVKEALVLSDKSKL